MTRQEKQEKTEQTGKVWLVGAGPGDAGLLTLKGAQVLEQAQVVVYDSLVGDGVLAMIPSGAETINVGKRAETTQCLRSRSIRCCWNRRREGAASCG